MNALAPIVAAPFDLNAAHMEAHRWVETARPLIVAYLALDQIDGDVRVASYGMGDTYWSSAIMDGAKMVSAAVTELYSQIEHVREMWIGDLSPPAPNRGVWSGVSQNDLDDYDDLCAMWDERIRDVISVDGAIRQIEEEA